MSRGISKRHARWFFGAFFGTFYEPFIATNNGYFADWAAFAFAFNAA
jgi:hypothetical protein